MTFGEGLPASPGLLLAAITLLGLVVGSFLNVVSLRLPPMMQAGWRRDARDILGVEQQVEEKPPASLWSPPSSCPHCGARIRPWHNIPVLGWILLRGHCADCKSPISLQYPAVELASGILSLVCAWHFGWSVELAGALLFTWALLVLTIIDLRTRMLPDSITLPLLWMGLLFSVWQVYCTPTASILGAAIGYLLLWTVYHLFRLATGKEGMGYGDFKLLAALGAWLGVVTLPAILVIASVTGAIAGLTLIASRRQTRAVPIAFGPYLAAAGWIVLIWGPSLAMIGMPRLGVGG